MSIYVHNIKNVQSPLNNHNILIGWVKKVESINIYGYTEDWYEYTGPKNKFCVFIAMLFCKETSLYISDLGWLFWAPRVGFYGDGKKIF